MDKQHRILVPQRHRELVGIDLSKSYALCVEDDKLFYLVDTDQYKEGIAVDVVNFDEKGRFCISTQVLEHYKIPEDAAEWVYILDKKIYISFD